MRELRALRVSCTFRCVMVAGNYLSGVENLVSDFRNFLFSLIWSFRNPLESSYVGRGGSECEARKSGSGVS